MFHIPALQAMLKEVLQEKENDTGLELGPTQKKEKQWRRIGENKIKPFVFLILILNYKCLE